MRIYLNIISKMKKFLILFFIFINRLEEENDNLRKQRNSFGDERDDLMKIVQRRDNEIQRYQDDVSNLTNQLDAISKSKCEALIKVEECESKQMSLEFKYVNLKYIFLFLS